MDRMCRMGAWACGEKVWKTLMSIEPQKQQGEKVRRTLICTAAAGVHYEGQALALRAPRRVFFVVRGPVLRDCLLILFILFILAILLQTRETLRS